MAFTPHQQERIVDMYNQGYSTIDIAKKTGYGCRAAIGYFLQDRGLTRTLLEIKALKAEKRIGTRIGKLTLLERCKDNAPDERWIWKCQCDCGKIKVVPECQLNGKIGRPLSCGCLVRGRNNHRWQGYEDLSITRFGNYKSNAKLKGVPFEIDMKMAWDLFVEQDRKCALTGVPICFSVTSKGVDGTASLDRIDSSKGYTIGNIQWVHKWINILKGGLHDDDLFTLVKAIYEYKGLNKSPLGDASAALSRVPNPKRCLH